MISPKNLLSMGLLAVMLTAASACTTVSKNPYLRANADLTPEDVRMWSRPGEFGYELKERVEATAYVTKVFGITVEGDNPPEDSVIDLLVGLGDKEKKKVENPLVRLAAARAIDNAKGDGIYVLRAEVNSTGLWPFYQKESATVRGISLNLKDLGQVSMDRADKERFLKASPRPCCNKE